MPKTYLVTGGSGFVGAGLVKRLVEDGHRVRALDNGLRGFERRLASVCGQYEYVEGDVRDYEAVARAAKGVDSIWHLAYVNGTQFFYSMPDVVLDVGVKGIINVIDACKNLGIAELILASSSEVYQTPPIVPTPEDVPLIIPDVYNARYSYGAGKIISEMLALNYGRQYLERMMIFRPHNVYGPDMGWEHVIPQFVLRMKEIVAQDESKTVSFQIQGDGTQTRSFIFIDDVVRALMLMLEHGKHMEIYNLGTQDEVTIAEVARMVAAHFQREIEIEPGPPAQGATMRRCPDIAKLKAFGFAPQVTLAEGIRQTASWYDANSDLAELKSSALR